VLILPWIVHYFQNDLVQVRQSYAEAVASQRRIQRQLDEVDQLATVWYNRAQLALRQQQQQQRTRYGNSIDSSSSERMAREALLRREMELERKSMIQKQLDTQTMATEQLYNAIRTLEDQIREVMLKQQQLIARARAAEATKQIQSMISSTTQFDSTATAISNSMHAFTRMEQKVEAMEAAVEASIELNQLNNWSTSLALATSGSDQSTSKTSKRSLEDDFRYLEQSTQIEEELTFLKNQLIGTNDATDNSAVPAISAATSTTSSSSSFNPSVVREEQQPRQIVTIPILTSRRGDDNKKNQLPDPE
jgi:phage shock protein A